MFPLLPRGEGILRKGKMKKDFNFIFIACAAAVILSFFSLPSYFFPREKLFSEDNPQKDLTDLYVIESEAFNELE